MIDDLPAKTAKNLRAIAAEVESIRPTSKYVYSINFQDLTSPRCLELRNQLRDDLGAKFFSIYKFQLCDVVSVERLNEVFQAAQKGSGGEIKFPRFNARNCRCLYVGSSRMTVKRLCEHLGYGSPKTYSLQLASWATELDGGITIEVYGFDSQNEPLITWLEDQLSQDEAPLLGRRGSK